MADTFKKKDLQQKRAKKKQDKQDRKEERNANNNKGKSFEEMIAYVDEYGNITDVPPDKQNRKQVKLEDIQLGAAPVVEEKDFSGTLSSFFTDKAFGFIMDDQSRETIFVHSNNFLEAINLKDKVTYERERTPKGYAAINVRKVK